MSCGFSSEDGWSRSERRPHSQSSRRLFTAFKYTAAEHQTINRFTSARCKDGVSVGRQFKCDVRKMKSNYLSIYTHNVEKYRRYECADIIYDLMMTHVAKAILHSRVAAKLISSGPSSDLRASGEHLKYVVSNFTLHVKEINISRPYTLYLSNRHAMGVLLSLRTIIPTWLAPPEMKRPIELFEPVRNALFLYFSALASKLAVIKAMQKEGGTAASLMCKLCIYVSNQMGGAIALLSTYPSQVHADVLLRGALDREVFAALAMFYYAEDAYAKLETGIALGFCQLALV
jgi:hypothetical protein